MSSRQIFTFLFLLIVSIHGLFAQEGIDNIVRPTTQAVKITEKPTIDGEVLTDPVWLKVNTLPEMVQNQPNWGIPPSEKTDIRIAYDATTFYLSVVCYDANPEGLVVSDARRDANLEGTDAFLFILDTYHDSQNGFVFGTNSVGIEYDAQVDNEGQGNFNNNRQQGGVIGGFNLNWDASWVVKTKVGDFGWSAEFAIPFRTLRFKSGENTTWGINFRRNIRKTNEIAFWSPLPLGLDMKRLSLAGTLTGLNIKNPGNLKAIPYVLGRLDRDFTEADGETKFDSEVGVDVKYSVTPSITLDLTYNTDFAQVEVDDQQVNLDRFNLFFPEKRPFFLENAGYFTVGSPGEVDLFFSRRIGIADGGIQTPIIGGARLSGKINKTAIGFLNMTTDDVPDLGVRQNNFTVARINHQEGRSGIGGMFANRVGLGDDSEGDYNRTYAIDGRLGLGRKAKLSGYLAKTDTPELEGKDLSFQFRSDYNWNGWRMFAGYTEVGENFNPEVGFLGRSGGFKKAEGLIFYTMRPKKESSRFLENRPHISYRGYWDAENRYQTGFLHIDNHWVWKNAFEIHTGINFTTQGVAESFEISDGVIVPAGVYDHAESQIVIITNPSKPVSISTRHINGGFFGGTRFANSGSLNLILGDKFNASFSMQHNDIRLPQGDFIADIFRARLAYSFTPNIFVQSLIQYNSVAELWSANIRFGWLQQANTGLFLVYNENRGQLSELVNGPLNRSFILKYSRMFDVLR